MNKTLHTVFVAFLAFIAFFFNDTAALPTENPVLIPRRSSISDGDACGDSANCKLVTDSSPYFHSPNAKSMQGKPLGAYKVGAGKSRARPGGPKKASIPGSTSVVKTTTTPKPTPVSFDRRAITTITSMSTRTVTSPVTSMSTIRTLTSTKTEMKATTISGRRTSIPVVMIYKTVQITPVVTMTTKYTTIPVIKTITVAPTSSTTKSTTVTISTSPKPVPTTTTVKPTSTTPKVVVTPTPTSTQVDTSNQMSARIAMLNAHNKYRAKHGVPALIWDDSLTSYAADYASKCIWAHSHGPYGENGASAVGFPMSMAMAVDMWYDEIKDYNFNVPDWSEATGHFTQLVWKASSRVGCAIAQCSPSSLGFNWPYPDPAYNVWCEYSDE
ncbi:unnamed protein product, partial [Tilletia controversa]